MCRTYVSLCAEYFIGSWQEVCLFAPGYRETEYKALGILSRMGWDLRLSET